MNRVEAHERFEGVYWLEYEGKRYLATENLTPGYDVYGEPIIRDGKREYRLWSHHRSKLAAAIMKGISTIFLRRGARVLYLGSATGTTVSHVSDIIGPKGIVYGVDFSPKVMQQFIRNVCERRSNVIPILADANIPIMYSSMVGRVEILYCDVAQPEQAKLVAENARLMLSNGGGVLVAVKARSIDSVDDPRQVIEREVKRLELFGFKVLESVSLDPYERDHVMVAAVYP
jgi:fibrillarin-like rRNA methylase